MFYLIVFMITKLKTNIMAFKNIFKDDNDVNEKNVIGFFSFIVMIAFAVADLVTGLMGIDLMIQDYIYNSFAWITLGSFSISGIEKFSKKTNDE